MVGPMERISRSVARVEEALRAKGIEARVQEMPSSTRTARDAADAVGCEVGQIAKSLVFVTDEGQVLVAVTSGSNRVDLARLSERVGAPVQMADPDTVRAATGYAIGGVPPLGLETEVPIYIDRDLMEYEAVWAAAGTPRSVFRITPRELVEATGGAIAAFTEEG